MNSVCASSNNPLERALLAAVSLSIVVLAFLGCSTDNQRGALSDAIDLPAEAYGLMPEDVDEFVAIDLEQLFAGAAPDDYLDQFSDRWEDALRDVGVNWEDVSRMAFMETDSSNLRILQGNLDFQAVRDELSDAGFEEDEYRGFELWTDGRIDAAETVALIEKDGYVVFENRGDDLVLDVLRGLDRGTGLVGHEEDSDLSYLLDQVDAGWYVYLDVGDQCGGIDLSNCETLVWSTLDERGDLVVVWRYLFSDDDSADSAAIELEGRFNAIGAYAEVKIVAEDQIVVVEAEIDDEDWNPQTWAVPVKDSDNDRPAVQSADTQVVDEFRTSTQTSTETDGENLTVPAPESREGNDMGSRVEPSAQPKSVDSVGIFAPNVRVTVTIAVDEISPLIQEPRRDIRATGGIGKDLSIYETIVRAPHVSPPAPPPQDHTSYAPSDLGLAESWEVTTDFSSITYTIRENIPWHDNGGNWGDLKTEDVAWTFNSAFASNSVNNGAQEIGPAMKLGFEVIDDRTVRQNIEPSGFDPRWTWLQGNASYHGVVVVSKTAFDELGWEGFGAYAIGTGKYRVDEWIGGDKIVLERVRDHWTGIQPSVENVTIVQIPRPAAREAALRAGEIDIGELSPQVIDQVVNDIGGKVQEIGIARPQGFQMAGNYWSIQCSDCEGGIMPRPGWEEGVAKGLPWIGDPSLPASMEAARKVRWALALAIDRESIIENELGGPSRVIYTWQNILPDDPSHKNEWVIPYDVDMAKRYMSEAGVPDGFDMEIWVPETFSPNNIAAAGAAAEMWRSDLGISVTIDRTEYGARRPQTVDKTINVPFIHGINWIPGAVSARYICPNPGHIVGFTLEQEYCDIGLSNADELDVTRRIANNIAVQDYLSHQMLFVPLFQHPYNLFAVAGTVAEWDPYNSQDVLPNRPESIVLAAP